MNTPSLLRFALLPLAAFGSAGLHAATPTPPISGVYPELCTYAYDDIVKGSKGGHNGECGIGAVVPWAGKLWMVNYAPHAPTGSEHKLYSVDENFKQTIHPESVGGTPACRMIHKESNQLLIGPYLIDAKGKVRVITPKKMPGRLTAIARHLTDPVNKVYYVDMEGMIYEVNVNTLEVNKLFNKPVPGWHGKGGYTSQGRLVVSNNGETVVHKGYEKDLKAGGPPTNPEEAGVLAEWDGTTWKIVERRQFTDVTGPGGIHGAPSADSPLWAMGWDKRSIRLKLLDRGVWSTFLLPKAAHNNDPKHGWYTEWPRIRQVGGGRYMADMHGMFFDFPGTFSTGKTGGIRPIGSHLRYVPDFCDWNGKLVLATDETSIFENPLAGQAQSNLWIGSPDELKNWGPASGYGGPWIEDDVKAGVPSDPFLIAGFDRRMLHLVNHGAKPVAFTLEIDKNGDGQWSMLKTLEVAEGDYVRETLPADLSAEWIRIKPSADCRATAYFHLTAAKFTQADEKLFSGLATAGTPVGDAPLLYPAKTNHNLVIVGDKGAFELSQKFAFTGVERDAKLAARLQPKSDFIVDQASVVVKDRDGTVYRLPKGDSRLSPGVRGIRECESERNLADIHGTFYEIPRHEGVNNHLPDWGRARPVATHNRPIRDFCTWSGLLVISGVDPKAASGEHIVRSPDGSTAVWLGAIDDLWKFGKPRGEGGPWAATKVEPGKPSDAYLMTGYDSKTMTLESDKDAVFTVEVDFDHQTGWHRYATFPVKAGKPFTHRFREGFSAHWVRVTSDTAATATARFKYE